MKFGGTSVGSPERILRVVDIIGRSAVEGPIAVVVSAMEHSTDSLIRAADLAATGDLAGAERVVDGVSDLVIGNGLVALRSLEAERPIKYHPEVTPRVREALSELRKLLYGVSLLRERTAQTLDLVMSFGERTSAMVLSELVCAAGIPATFVDARSWCETDDRFGAAAVDQEASRQRLAALAAEWQGRVPVVTGFLGQTRDGRTTTLGRNGSDYTASLLARFLEASEVVVWTDVPGVMTADPAIVADAYPLARMSFSEALELVDFGATMFHPRTMIPLIEAGIPMRIRSTMQPDDPGTLIDGPGGRDESHPTSVTSLENLALLGVHCRAIAKLAPVGGRVLAALEAAGVTVSMASESGHGQAVAFTVPVAQVDRARAAVEHELSRELAQGEVQPLSVQEPVTLLTLVAEGMGRTADCAGRFFQSLSAVGVGVKAIAQGASSRSISCAIDGADTVTAVRTVHAAFNFARQEVNLLVLGRGTVGSAFLDQVASQRGPLERQHDVLLRVVGMADSRTAVFDEAGIPIEGWRGVGTGAGGGDLPGLLERLRRLPVPILVDCTGADGMERLYAEAFQRGVHVAGANKKPLTIPWPERERLMGLARARHGAWCYETTVGAGLPVIETLKDLVRTGDRVTLIEGAFSGSLGYLSNELMRGVALSEAVARARDLGFTEPDPGDDLSGVDVARKALILARELGLPVEMADVVVEPFVPLEDGGDAGNLLERLRALDPLVADRVRSMREEGLTLRYLARIEPGRATSGGEAAVTVGPVGIPADHPATLLRGPEAFVAFTTERYSTCPLTVSGSGAGGPVTAAGVLADVLKISMKLRGR